MKRAFISVISLRILASEACICYNRAFARIHFFKVVYLSTILRVAVGLCVF